MNAQPQLYRLLEELEPIESADVYSSGGVLANVSFNSVGERFSSDTFPAILRPVPAPGWIPLSERPPAAADADLQGRVAVRWRDAENDADDGADYWQWDMVKEEAGRDEKIADLHWLPLNGAPPLYNPPQVDESRKEFEKAVNSIGGGTYFDRKPSGEYTNANTEFAWNIWQATRASGNGKEGQS